MDVINIIGGLMDKKGGNSVYRYSKDYVLSLGDWDCSLVDQLDINSLVLCLAFMHFIQASLHASISLTFSFTFHSFPSLL